MTRPTHPSFPSTLDHVVIAGRSLSAVVARVAELTGVTAQPGGRHDTGTENALIRLTVPGEPDLRFLELIGPRPDRTAPADRDAFGVKTRAEIGIATFCVRPDSLAEHADLLREAGIEPEPEIGMSRKTPDGTLLSWRLLPSPEGVPTRVEPFAIDWLASAHPAGTTEPALRLLGLWGTHPRAAELAGQLDAADIELEVLPGGAPGLSLLVGTPLGEVLLDDAALAGR